ncbi:hypothetical protein AMECASPLE_015341 [Ameca splendens]|uniref:Uncharacterized protein n=1 Tax=Ameca splendens TaxID=208324 RepID=A0ABV0Y1U1_9TELE
MDTNKKLDLLEVKQFKVFSVPYTHTQTHTHTRTSAHTGSQSRDLRQHVAKYPVSQVTLATPGKLEDKLRLFARQIRIFRGSIPLHPLLSWYKS